MLEIQREIKDRKAAQLRAVMQVSRKINTTLDLEQLLVDTVHLIKKTFGFDTVSVYLLDQYDRFYLYHTACTEADRSNPNNCPHGKRVHISQGMVGWVVRNEQTRLANDVSRDPYYIHCINTQAELDMPLKVNDRCIGVLNIEQPHIDAFDPEDVPVLEILSEQIATAIENARLHARAREAAVAEERNRLARELHDDTVQSLIGLGRQIDLLRCDLSDTLKGYMVTSRQISENQEGEADCISNPLPEHIERRLNRLQDSLEGTISNLRLLSRDLQPKLLSDLGLLAALDGLASDISRHSLLKVNTDLHEDVLVHLNPAQQLNLYRVTQEALYNIVKHASARQVNLKLYMADDTICLVISDDGCGFAMPEDVNSLASNGGLGVLNMRQRAKESGGCLKINSSPGNGTTLELCISLVDVTRTR
jgi:signal transduction histidine kinase